jgi:hypothetical protein
MKLEAQDRADRPGLYSLRDEIAQQGMPTLAANTVAREIYALLQKVAALETKVAKLEQATPPHLQTVERR